MSNLRNRGAGRKLDFPQDGQAEAACLACVLQSGDKAGAMLDQLEESSFHDFRHAEVYRALVSLQFDSAPMDVATVVQRLGEQGRLQAAGGVNYVANLPDAAPSAANFEHWLRIVRDRARRRAMLRDSEKLRAQALDVSLPVLASDGMLNARRLTARRPDEILALKFDDADCILGDRLLAIGQSLVLLGPGGIGKSRLLLQFAVAVRAGLQFLGLDTRCPGLRILILQAENSNRRLRDDLAALREWVGPKSWGAVNDGLIIHTLETDADGLLSLDNRETQSRIEDLIREAAPDVIGWDSLFNFGIGDLNSDQDMAATLLAISRLTKAGKPGRCPVVLHHALTGRSGAARASGYDRSSYSRNSKVLHSWTRGQINIAPGSADSNDILVLTCGKCSNGKEFAPFAAQLNPVTMIYEPAPDFDFAAWQGEVSGKPDRTPVMTPARVRELCKPLSTKVELAKAIMGDSGCAKATAYRYIIRANGKTIRFNKADETYSAK